MKRLFTLAAVAVALLITAGLTSCSKENNEKEAPQIQEASIKTSDYTTWTYFSFEKGVIGTYTEDGFDYKNRLDWDLAFHRWDVRTNGGLSGKGAGGAVKSAYGTLDVNTWGSVLPSAADFVTDKLIKTYMNAPHMSDDATGDQRVEVPANTELGQWLTVTMTSIPPTYKMADNVFLVKAANGKLAAVKFTNYMNAKAEKGYAVFEYVYPLN